MTTHKNNPADNLSQEARSKGGQHSHGGGNHNQGESAHTQGKDPVRVEAGKKAAETRGHESLAEAGRKGGQHSHGGGRPSEE